MAVSKALNGMSREPRELFLDRASLIERLPSLPEAIATAATSGVLERSVFEARYLEAACALYGAAESSPVGCP
jgi:hypothetical protein